jgi:hypothetical protein
MPQDELEVVTGDIGRVQFERMNTLLSTVPIALAFGNRKTPTEWSQAKQDVMNEYAKYVSVMTAWGLKNRDNVRKHGPPTDGMSDAERFNAFSRFITNFAAVKQYISDWISAMNANMLSVPTFKNKTIQFGIGAALSSAFGDPIPARGAIIDVDYVMSAGGEEVQSVLDDTTML